jgi:hypothetical protein
MKDFVFILLILLNFSSKAEENSESIDDDIQAIIQEQEIIISNYAQDLNTLKEKCAFNVNLCNISTHPDPIQHMQESDMCLVLLSEQFKTIQNDPCTRKNGIF